MGFSLSLVLALAITGFIWSMDVAFLAPARRRRLAAAVAAGADGAVQAKAGREPLLVEYAKSFFPVILIVLVLRSFVVEPFRIPSGSMIPTLDVGDFILVNKFAYGLRLPAWNVKILNTGEPKRGDVVVFRYPKDPSEDFVKRVVGLPGDHISYINKQILVNGVPAPRGPATSYLYNESGNEYVDAHEYVEDLGGVKHKIITIPGMGEPPQEFVVPPHEYFMMGDNRDLSNDSRYWGFVPEANLVGRAFLIWFSWDVADGKGVDWARIGHVIH